METIVMSSLIMIGLVLELIVVVVGTYTLVMIGSKIVKVVKGTRVAMNK